MNNLNVFNKPNVNQISLTGDLCSGKSTTCKILVDKLNLEYISVGVIFRKEAESKGISVLELNKQYEASNDDLILDKKIFDLRSTPNLVVDARMGWFFLPESFKVYLKTDPKEIVKRALKSDRGPVEDYSNEEEAFKLLHDRKQSEIERFNRLYDVDFDNPSNFDLIVDTTNLTVDEVADKIITGFEQFKKNKVIMFNFNNLLPGQNIRMLRDEDYKDLPVDGMEPIKVVKDDNYYWIVDGHNRASKCKLNNKRVPCVLVNPKDVRYDKIITNLYDWEDAFNFRYVFHPFQK